VSTQFEYKTKAASRKRCWLTYSYWGVPATGLIDSGAYIAIMGAEPFKKVAAVARLKKSAFKKPDKTPYTSQACKLELDITFDNCTMRTPVYVKMDARDPLLLSESVCHQLGIIKYQCRCRPACNPQLIGCSCSRNNIEADPLSTNTSHEEYCRSCSTGRRVTSAWTGTTRTTLWK
jgi:hypothetical protein